MYHLLRLLLLVVSSFAAVGLSACQKEPPAPELTTDSLLEGRWELIQTSGGIAGRAMPADPTQKKEIMFEPNGQVQFLLNGTATTSATFTLTQALAHTTSRTETFVAYGAPAATLRQYLAEALLKRGQDQPIPAAHQDKLLIIEDRGMKAHALRKLQFVDHRLQFLRGVLRAGRRSRSGPHLHRTPSSLELQPGDSSWGEGARGSRSSWDRPSHSCRRSRISARSLERPFCSGFGWHWR